MSASDAALLEGMRARIERLEELVQGLDERLKAFETADAMSAIYPEGERRPPGRPAAAKG